MIRTVFLILAMVAIVASPVSAQAKRKSDPETSDGETSRKGRGAKAKESDAKGKEADAKATKSGKGRTDGKGKPVQVGTFGAWGAFTAAQGKTKTCYALTQPRERAPEAKRDPAYIFVSNRPGEQVSIIMGFPMKDNSNAKAEIGGTSFDLICKGNSAWLEDPKKEDEFIATLKRGSKLVIKASAAKGGLTTDSYSLAGLSDALARVQKDCP